MTTVVLLALSNVFMNFAWYGHLKFKSSPMWVVILASWGLAFFEYCLQVPANRWGHGRFSATQLKVLQEGISISVFVGIAAFYLKERLRWNHWAAFLLLLAAVALAHWPHGDDERDKASAAMAS
jgi:hypothetical protein